MVLSTQRIRISKESEMRQAKDYIVFPLDVSSADEARSFVELLAEHVGLFKVGLELFIRSGYCALYQCRRYSRCIFGFETT